MPGTRKLRWLGLVLLVLAGCQSADPDIKPKNVVEEYAAPPQNDTRYNSTMTYPQSVLFEDATCRAAASSASSAPTGRVRPPSSA